MKNTNNVELLEIVVGALLQDVKARRRKCCKVPGVKADIHKVICTAFTDIAVRIMENAGMSLAEQIEAGDRLRAGSAWCSRVDEDDDLIDEDPPQDEVITITNDISPVTAAKIVAALRKRGAR